MRTNNSKIRSAGLLVAALSMLLIPCAVAGPVAKRISARAKHNTTRSALAQQRLNAQLEVADRSGPRGSPDFFRFRSLLAQGADPNAPRHVGSLHPTEKNSTTWLIWYSALGNKQTVQALLYHGAEVNARGYGIGHLPGPSAIDNSTALIVACGRSDNGDVIQLLLAHGAKVNVHDISGRTPLEVASWKSDQDECAQLRQYGASEKYSRRWERKLFKHEKDAQ